MVGFLEHVTALTSSVPESSERDKRAVDDWTRLSSQDGATGELDELEYEERWDGVLERFSYGPPLLRSNHSDLLARLLSKPQAEPLLVSLNALLSSSRPNESISDELAETIGFEEIELAMEILEHRSSLSQEISQYLAACSVPKDMNAASASVSNANANGFDEDSARARIEETLRANAARPLYTGVAHDAPEILPHVYTSSSMASGNVLSHLGSKFMLPVGTTRVDREDYEEVTIPPARPVPPRINERLIPVSELDPLCKGSFPGYSSLNRIQSIVYPTAYHSNENVLVCAPTGAGKTDVAMLTVLRVLDQYRSTAPTTQPLSSTIRRDDFKIIYVAPMKALASEIVRKLGKRLQWLSIRVRELTGDMQMTKAEIAETQIIVTTPEKWDVVTRKPTGEGELASKVKLLIIDEVHLLNDERGAVIETIVARTLRQVESSQSVIRIIGLSATLPNYIDVADFLGVNRHTGLFYFDSSFRPVPLEQHFIGVRGKPNSPASRKNLDRATFEKVSELVHQGHQVMVFVHARKETVNTAMTLKEAAMMEGSLDEFSCEDHPSYSMFKRDIGQSRNKEMKQLFDAGFGIHHAGMLRTDRNMMERMFEARAIKVLCCTATLAWGVNLPAHAVIIKGTQVYDSAKGAFTDLSVLDVLQIFGRAGRPGLESSGVGYICTTHDKIDHYLDSVTSQNPIESKFIAGIIDAMNAEIALGTVASIQDAIRWLGYTYLFVRMRKNPLQYGIPWNEVQDDPALHGKRHSLAIQAASKLAEATMIAFDRATGNLTITDLGRIAAKFYIRHASVEIFNKEFRTRMSEADVLAVLCMSTEFDQIKVRENEVKELEQLMEAAPCKVKGGTDTSQGKVNILLQAYVSGYRPEDFALVSDQAYAAQNAGRIVRALLEIAISRKWANAASVLMGMSKAIEKRLWPFDQPLKQFPLKQEVFYGLERFADEYTVSELAELSAEELGKLVHLNERHGSAIRDAAQRFPTAGISFSLRPLGPDVLKISTRVTREFKWDSKIHGNVEPFWLWVEDHDGLIILQLSHLVFRQTSEALDVDFVISIPNAQPPPSVIIRFVSDKWMGAEEELVIPLDDLVMPTVTDSHTPRLDIPFLSLDVLHDQVLQDVLSARIHGLNGIQSQVYWSVVNTRLHSLICAPAGSGKSMLGQLVVWRTLQNAGRGSWALLVAPRRTLLNEFLADLRPVCRLLDIATEIVSPESSFTPPSGKCIRLATAHTLRTVMSRIPPNSHKNAFGALRLVVCDNLELLDFSYELAVSALLHATQQLPTRFVGISSSLNDAADLAAWLNVDPRALHSFRPVDRDQSLTVSTHTFTIPQSAALSKAMAKPAHTAIQGAPGEPAIVFVPSRGQCRPIALDLITQCALEMETTRGYLSEDVSPDALEHYLARLQDRGLIDFVTRGIGFFHEGIPRQDRLLILELYAEGIIRVLMVPHDSCWSLPVRAATVVVMGTQYVHVTPDASERQLRDYNLEELVRMQGRAVRHNGAGHFHLFCQAEAKDTILRFLTDGLPLESKLLEGDDLRTWYAEERRRGAIRSKQDAIDALSFTFLSHRLQTNPVFYDAPTEGGKDYRLSRIVDDLDSNP
ncbi:Sec63 domain-containing protein [Phanerochaete sordida]|uniref:Sec63 domain-containing protein n=1 Tax=Phanerochaete sordida TaxID=48140 RepID=A0A9P3L7F8_9APHY|nr:Sec63 domain-containing protein [Phanerochaete sordida]